MRKILTINDMMSTATPVLVSWSGGKDSALMLGRLRADSSASVAGLFTSVIAGEDRVAMHGVSVELVRKQAAACGLPLLTMEIPAFPPNRLYEAALARVVDRFRSLGVQRIAFGDLFVEEIRRYREDLCARLGLTALFPLWGENTADLAEMFFASNYRAVVCCTNETLGRSAVGMNYSPRFVHSLPAKVDPCGENGEFHTFVTAGPEMKVPVPAFVAGTYAERGFWYADLVSIDDLPRNGWPQRRSRRTTIKLCGEGAE